MNETLFWSRTSELVMLVSMMSQSAMIQSSYNLPTPTIINRLGDICWCGDSRGEECKADKDYYHTSNFRECMGVNSSCMQLIKAVFFTASHARICISTTSHVKIRIRYCKSRVLHLKKISLVCCRWHCYSCCALITIRQQLQITSSIGALSFNRWN